MNDTQEKQNIEALIKKLEQKERELKELQKKAGQVSEKKLLIYICDICGATRNGQPNKRCVDAPYLSHIKRDQLVNVCPECLKQVITISPSDSEEENWGI